MTPGGTDWEGDAKDAALNRATADISIVLRQGEVQGEAADIAENGGRDLQAAKREALEAITEAEQDGFRVGEDLSVTDGRRANPLTMADRQRAAAEHAEDIRWYAERLAQADAFTGERLHAKAAELEGIRFDDEDEGRNQPPGSVQLVDNKIEVNAEDTPAENDNNAPADRPAQAPGRIGPFSVPKSVADRAEHPSETGDVGGTLEDLLQPKDAPPDKPGDEKPGGLPAALSQMPPKPLDPNSPEGKQVLATARQSLHTAGAPPEDVERTIQAIQASGRSADEVQRMLDNVLDDAKDNYNPPDGARAPEPGIAEGFGDRWRDMEQGVKNLFGVGGPGAPGVLESWKDLNDDITRTLTNPIGVAKDEAEHALNSPNPAYYFGEKLADGAAATPGLVLGPEAALAGRGAIIDSPGIPHEVVDTPGPNHHSPTVADHPAPTTMDHSAPVGGGNSSGGITHAPEAGAPPPPLPPDSPLFDGYHAVDPGPAFANPDGGLIYPDDNLPNKPYAVPGTVVDNAQIPQGTVIDRFGYPGGAYLSPEGVPFAERALPPDSASKPYYQYVVDDPSKLPPEWHIEQSQAAPWFHQPGGGTQYRIIAPDGDEASVEALVDWGYLKEVK